MPKAFQTTLFDITRNLKTDEVNTPKFRPFMIETAYYYFDLARKAQQGTISETLHALCIEIILKSFNSVVTKNSGSIDERYKFEPPRKNSHGNSHDLHYLLDICPAEFRYYLCSNTECQTDIETYRNHFTQKRYIYEASVSGESRDVLCGIAADFLMKTIHLYRAKGCIDPFITNTQFDSAYTEVLSTQFIIA
mgnify:CR=1 FL=1